MKNAIIILLLALFLMAQNPPPPSVPVTTVNKLKVTYATTVAGLPSCNTSDRGLIVWVSDATPEENVWGAAVTAGGSGFWLLVLCDGFGTWHTMGN